MRHHVLPASRQAMNQAFESDLSDPWDRRPGESGKAFSAFEIYLYLGQRRSIAEASRLYHSQGASEPERNGKPDRNAKKASGRIRHWARTHSWVTRAMAYDAEQARIQKLQDQQEAREMRQRHIDEALLAQQKAIERLKEVDPSQLSVKEALDFLVKGTTLERQAKGLPTEILEHSGPGGGLIPITTIEVYKQQEREEELA